MFERAAALRNNPPEPEIRLWRALRASQLSNFKFRRRAVIGYRIVDFFCPAKGLVVEIDGETHDREKDLRRDASFERETGFRVVRFTNDDVMRNLEGVLIALQIELKARPDRWSGRRSHHPPTPSSSEEGEK